MALYNKYVKTFSYRTQTTTFQLDCQRASLVNTLCYKIVFVLVLSDSIFRFSDTGHTAWWFVIANFGHFLKKISVILESSHFFFGLDGHVSNLLFCHWTTLPETSENWVHSVLMKTIPGFLQSFFLFLVKFGVTLSPG